MRMTFLLMQSWMKVFWSKASPQYFSLVRLPLITPSVHSGSPSTLRIAKLVDYVLYIKTAGTPLHAFFGDRDTICHMQAGGDGAVCAEAWVLSDLPEGSRELAEKAMTEQEQADQASVERSLAVPDDE